MVMRPMGQFKNSSLSRIIWQSKCHYKESVGWPISCGLTDSKQRLKRKFKQIGNSQLYNALILGQGSITWRWVDLFAGQINKFITLWIILIFCSCFYVVPMAVMPCCWWLTRIFVFKCCFIKIVPQITTEQNMMRTCKVLWFY